MFSPDFPEKPAWLNHLEKASNKKKLQYCSDSYGDFLYMRVFQGHSGGNEVDPSLQDNVEILYNSVEYTYHFGSSHDCNSVF